MTKSILAFLVVSASALAQSSNEGRARWQQFHQEFQAACGADLQSLCGSEEGRGKFKCLRSPANAQNISEKCSNFLETHPMRHRGQNKSP